MTFGAKELFWSRMSKHIVVALTLSVLLGCSSTNVILLGDQKAYPLRTPSQKILVFAEKPETTFVQLALIDCSKKSQKKAIKIAKEEASKIGADAIILWDIDKEIRGGTLVGNTVIIKKRTLVKVIAIRFIP